jgi:2-polyprenyl-3-methyl-5-hydroxy-6-metoxy-1,4-benzoquinol methylase
MGSTDVEQKIKNGNPWYINEQFKWANYPYVINIYNGRFGFISTLIKEFCQKNTNSVNLIDLGCGDGVWLNRLSELGIKNLQLTGLDYNELRINRARTILKSNIKLITSDIQKLGDEKFDIVLLNHVIEHIQEDEALLNKIRTILRKDGILILGTPNEGNYLMQRRNRKYGIFLTTDHVHFYTEKEISNKISNASFKIMKTYRDPLYIGNDNLFYKILTHRIGFLLLKLLSNIIPQYCAGYIFLLKANNEKDY